MVFIEDRDYKPEDCRAAGGEWGKKTSLFSDERSYFESRQHCASACYLNLEGIARLREHAPAAVCFRPLLKRGRIDIERLLTAHAWAR